MPVPSDLSEQIVRGNAVLWWGWDSGEGVTRPEVARILAEESGYTGHLELPAVANFVQYQWPGGRVWLVERLRTILSPRVSSVIPQRLAEVGFSAIVTPRYDLALSTSLRTIVDDTDVAYSASDRPFLVKLYGALDRPGSLVLTDDDYDDFFAQRPRVVELLRTLLASRAWLIVSDDLNDPLFKRLYREVLRDLGPHQPPRYAVGASNAPVDYWHRQGVRVLPDPVPQFLDELIAAVSQARPPIQAEAQPTVPVARRPYKFLDFFDERDADIFFGREAEREELVSKILAYRVMVLYGRSGTGKTSLLRAGATPKLRKQGYKVVYTRAADLLGGALPGAICNELGLSVPDTPVALDEFLHSLKGNLSTTLVICLDQFEEFFDPRSGPLHNEVAADLGRCVADTRLPLRFVFALREDFLGELDALREPIPSILQQWQRLQPLGVEAARQAIIEPARLCGIEYEPGLVEQLLTDLDVRGVEPPQLQIVCDKLYDQRDRERRVIPLSAYDQLGGAEQILTGYLEEVLVKLPLHQRSLARDLLKQMVTTLGTRIRTDAQGLAEELQAYPQDVEQIMVRLVAARLLRPVERDQGYEYELTHEYLAIGINAWIDEAEWQLKRAREVLSRDLVTWQSTGLLMDANRMRTLDACRDQLRRLQPLEQELLLRSALVTGHDAVYWLGRVDAHATRQRVLDEYRNHKQPTVRQQVAVSLAHLSDANFAIERLLNIASSDSDVDVRSKAVDGLRLLSAQGHRQLIVAGLHDLQTTRDRRKRRHVRDIAAYFPEAIVRRRDRWGVPIARVRLTTGKAYRQAVPAAYRRIVRAALLTPVLLLALLYVFLANSYYLSTFTNGTIVVRAGHSGWKFLPGVGLSMVVTDFSVGDLDSTSARADLTDERVGGLWLSRSNGYRGWGKQLLARLSPAEAGLAYWRMGQTDKALEQLRAALTDANSRDAVDATRILGKIALHEPGLTSRVVVLLVDALESGEEDVRSPALEVLNGIRDTQPETVSEALDALDVHLSDSDAERRIALVEAMGVMGQGQTQIATQTIAVLKELLQSEDEASQLAALRAMTTLGAANPALVDATIPELEALISDTDHPQVQRTAIESLVILPFPADQARSLTTALLAATESSDSSVQRAALHVLGHIGAHDPVTASLVVPQLSIALTTDDWGIKQTAVETIGQLGETGAVPEPAKVVGDLEQVLLTDSRSEIRGAAALALGRVGGAYPQESSRIMAILDQGLQDSDVYVRHDVVQALGSILATQPQTVDQAAAALDAVLQDRDTSLRRQAAELALLSADILPTETVKAALDVHMQAMHDDDLDVESQARSFLNNLVTQYPKSAQAVAVVLSSQLPRIKTQDKEAAFVALRKVGPLQPSIVPEVVVFLAENLSDSAVGWEAQEALIALAAQPDAADNAVNLIVNKLTDTSYAHRPRMAVALRVLGRMNDILANRAVQSLSDAMLDANTEVRQAAAEALGYISIDYPQAVLKASPILMVHLADDEPSVQAACAKAFRLIGRSGIEPATGTVESLVNALGDPDRSVRLSAMLALAEIGGRYPELTATAVEPLRASMTSEVDEEIRLVAARALGTISGADREIAEAAVSTCRDALRSSSVENRQSAIIALQAMGSSQPEAADVVIEALHVALSDPDVETRRRVIVALREIGSANSKGALLVIPALADALHDSNSDIRWHAIANGIQFIVESQPTAARTSVSVLWGALDDDDWMVQNEAQDALVRVYTLLGQESLDELWRPLKSNSSGQRYFAREALMQLVRKHPDLEVPVRAQLNRLRRDVRPHVRLAAAQASEMLDVIEWSRSASSNPRDASTWKAVLEWLPSDGLGSAKDVALQELSKALEQSALDNGP